MSSWHEHSRLPHTLPYRGDLEIPRTESDVGHFNTRSTLPRTAKRSVLIWGWMMMLAELYYLLENTILLNKHYFQSWNNQSPLKAAFKILRISGPCSEVYQMDIFDDHGDLWSPGRTRSTVGIFFFHWIVAATQG